MIVLAPHPHSFMEISTTSCLISIHSIDQYLLFPTAFADPSRKRMPSVRHKIYMAYICPTNNMCIVVDHTNSMYATSTDLHMLRRIVQASLPLGPLFVRQILFCRQYVFALTFFTQSSLVVGFFITRNTNRFHASIASILDAYCFAPSTRQAYCM
jgi:hypothetical protein